MARVCLRGLALLVLLCVFVPADAQRVYRWVDEHGQVQYTQTPPPEMSVDDGMELGGAGGQVDRACCAEIQRFSRRVAHAMRQGLSLTELYDLFPAETYPHVVEVANFIAARSHGEISPSGVGSMAMGACLNRTFKFCRLDDVGTGGEPLPGGSGASRARGSASGTAFLVAPNVLLTNHHVVDRCTAVTVGDEQLPATVVASDQSIDLALVRAQVRSPNIPLLRREASVVLGESVVVAGYPLGEILGSLNITTGSVSAETGIRGQAQLFQFTAPVQPGSSGGPVLDENGQLLGVVVSRMSDGYAMRTSGSVPQNVNFAIKPDVVRGFLDDHGVAYQTAYTDAPASTREIADQARSHTQRIVCER